MTREELTVLIHTYAEDYANFKIECLQTHTDYQPKPPINPVNEVLQSIVQLQQQVAYWKKSFKRQVEASRSAETGEFEKRLARRTF